MRHLGEFGWCTDVNTEKGVREEVGGRAALRWVGGEQKADLETSDMPHPNPHPRIVRKMGSSCILCSVLCEGGAYLNRSVGATAAALP